MQKAFFNWSGGKDSAFALYHVLNEGIFDIRYLLTTINSEYKRISMHGVREELLVKQAESLGLELLKLYMPEFTSMDEYNSVLTESMKSLKAEGIETAVFGDIFLQDLRDYRENKLAEAGIKSIFPIWKKDTQKLVRDFIDTGFKTIITSVDERFLDKSFAGRIIDNTFLKDLPANVDPCGENGEFHSFVFDGPIFKKAIPFSIGEKTYRKYKQNNNKVPDTGFWYCDIIPEKTGNFVK